MKLVNGPVSQLPPFFSRAIVVSNTSAAESLHLIDNGFTVSVYRIVTAVTGEDFKQRTQLGTIACLMHPTNWAM